MWLKIRHSDEVAWGKLDLTHSYSAMGPEHPSPHAFISGVQMAVTPSAKLIRFERRLNLTATVSECQISLMHVQGASESQETRKIHVLSTCLTAWIVDMHSTGVAAVNSMLICGGLGSREHL